mmetsp:Transcript_6031/g.23888  ORF Transcript_6031/g.23888 Transcript_6031/m.23888 type:complete len:309 (-) Transcript_6031:403-1329(-)
MSSPSLGSAATSYRHPPLAAHARAMFRTSFDVLFGKLFGATTANLTSVALMSFRSPTSSESASSGISREAASEARSISSLLQPTRSPATWDSTRRAAAADARADAASTRPSDSVMPRATSCADASGVVVRASHWSTPSTGGSPDSAARASAGSTPASAQSVAYQSAAWMGTSTGVPRTPAGIAPPETKAAARTPPSQGVYLPPRSGQLVAPLSSRMSGPPLSPLSTSSVSSHMPAALSLSTMAPTVSSRMLAIALYCARHARSAAVLPGNTCAVCAAQRASSVPRVSAANSRSLGSGTCRGQCATCAE